MKPVDGTLAEWAAVRADDLVAITADVADEEVAAIGTSGIAAWMALTWRAQLQPGERVVILGAGGAVGQVALAVARDRGAARMVAVCRRNPRPSGHVRPAPTRWWFCRRTRFEMGWPARLTEAAGGPVDVVIDPVFGQPAAAALLALGFGGRLVNLGGSAGDVAEFSSAVLRGRSISMLGYTNNAITADQRADALTRSCDWPNGEPFRSTIGCCRSPTAAQPGPWPAVPALGSSSRSDPHRW